MRIFLLLAMVFVLSGCNGERIVVQLPECKTSEKTIVRWCDNEIHAGGKATSSWEDFAPLALVGVELDNQTVEIPTEGLFRLCRLIDMCTKKSFSKDFPVPVGEKGFFLADADAAKIRGLFAMYFRDALATIMSILQWEH